MNSPRSFLKIDYAIHLAFGVLALLSAVSTLLIGEKVFWLLILLWPLLGAWQVISALVLGFRFQDETRLRYLLFVAIYFLILFFVASIDYFAAFWLCASLVLAIWYAHKTYKDATYSPKSFWDLEF